MREDTDYTDYHESAEANQCKFVQSVSAPEES
jgi:hypothetical protein